MIWRKGWVHPILNIVLGQILIAIARQGKFWFSNSSDDVCFLFYINPSSMSLHVSCTVCTLFFGWQCHLVNLHGSGADFLSSWMTDLKNSIFWNFFFNFFLFNWFGQNVFIFIFKIHSHPGSRSIICYGFGSGKFVLIRFPTCATSEPTRQLNFVYAYRFTVHQRINCWQVRTDLQCTEEQTADKLEQIYSAPKNKLLTS